MVDNHTSRGLLFVRLGILCILVAVGILWFSNMPPASNPIVELVPSNTGQPERCLTCHTGIEAISAAHPTEQFGCVSCHGGDRLALDAQTAHTGIVRNPGDLSVAEKYCGNCHAAQVAVVPRTLMATYSGAITLIRRAFGQQTDAQAHFATTKLDSLEEFRVSASDPAPVQKFFQECLTCHLRTPSIQEPYFYRSTGCSSCHVLYGDEGLYKGSDPTIPRDRPGYPTVHQITKQIPYTQCNHCHNRGNYDLRTMTFVKRTDLPPQAGLSVDQQRLQAYYQPIGQFTRCEYELDCIDCHTKLEVMGDGVLHNTRKDAVYVQCQTCHGTRDSLPIQVPVQEVYADATPPPVLVNSAATKILATSRGELLPNVQLIGDRWQLMSKVSGTTYTVPMVKGSACQQNPDQQSSSACHQCHDVSKDRTFVISAP